MKLNLSAIKFYLSLRRLKKSKGDESNDFTSPVVGMDALTLELGYGLIPLIDNDKSADTLECLNRMRREIALNLGLVLPGIRIIDNMLLGSSEYCIKIKGVDSGKGIIRMGYYLCINPSNVKKEIPGEKTLEPVFGLPALWITEERRDEAERMGYDVLDPPSIIAGHFSEVVKAHAADILGLQTTHDILGTLRNEYPAVVEEVLKEGCGLSLVDIWKVLQNLLKEKVSIRDTVTILEAIITNAPVSKNVGFLADKARQALAGQSSFQYASNKTAIKDIILFDAIKPKKMFYNARETDAIQTLISLLSEDNFRKIQDRLDCKGMDVLVRYCKDEIQNTFISSKRIGFGNE